MFKSLNSAIKYINMECHSADKVQNDSFIRSSQGQILELEQCSRFHQI